MDFLFLGAEVGLLRRCTQCGSERYPCPKCGSMQSERVFDMTDEDDENYKN